MKRAPILFSLISLMCIPLQADEPVVPTKPNIILIMADDVGIEAFSSYGALDYNTPNIDAIGTQGVRFTQCYAQPLCTPSRNQIMTGRYNHRNYEGFAKLDTDEITFGNLMQDAGYVTGIAGKWQLGRNRDLIAGFGFDEYLLWWLEYKTDRYNNVGDLIENGEVRTGGNGEYGPDVMADFVIDFITDHQNEPFFFYYPMILVHDPFDPTPDSIDQNETNKKTNFIDMVHYMDKIVGRIDAHLEALEIRDNTILIFTGDNGTLKEITSSVEWSSETIQVQGGKNDLTDAGTHVPLLVQWPARGVSGVVSDDLIDFTDFLPTIVAAGGGILPDDRTMDGVSFLPILKGEIGPKRDWVYSSYFDKWEFTRTDYIRTERYKLYHDGRFYDIPNDRLEESPIENPEGEALAVREFLEAEMAVVSTTQRTIPLKLYQANYEEWVTDPTDPIDVPSPPAADLFQDIFGYWDFEEGSGVGTDDFTSSHHGVITGASWVGAGAGRFGDALSFDGSGDYLTLGSSALDPTQGGTDLTISLWAKSDGSTAAQTWVGNRDSWSDNQFQFGIVSGGKVVIERSGSKANFGVSGTDDSHYHHYVLTFTSSDVGEPGLATLYVDGELIASEGYTMGALPSNRMLIGSSGTSNGPWSGDLDDVAIWSRVLHQDEIGRIYDAGLNGSPLSSLAGFYSWASGYGLDGTTGKESASADNPDGDDLNNLGEFALDGDPLSSSDGPKFFMLPNPSDEAQSNQDMTYTIAVRSGAPAFNGSPLSSSMDGVTYIVQGTLDLSDFTAPMVEVNPVATGLPLLSEDYAYRSFSFDDSILTPSKGFFRVTVTE